MTTTPSIWHSLTRVASTTAACLGVLTCLKKPREDPRAKDVGGDISIDESAAAAADGHRFREEQHELQGAKSKSRGTEVVLSPKLWFGPETSEAEVWKRYVEQFAEDSVVAEHRALYLDAKWLCRTGHVHWAATNCLGRRLPYNLVMWGSVSG